MTNREMVNRMVINREVVNRMMESNLTDIGTWMVESVLESLTNMQEMLGINTKSDEQCEIFYDAMWEAVARANSNMVAREHRLLTVLEQHIIKNAMVILESDEYWEEYEGFNKQEFEEAITRCQDGNGTDQDWDWLIEETEM